MAGVASWLTCVALSTCLILAEVDAQNNDGAPLLVIKASLSPPSAFSSWAPGTDFCKWQGITCTNGRATKIYLAGKQEEGATKLSGSLSPAVGNLTELQSLDVSFNTLTGSIPKEIGNLKKLQSLYLAFNNFSGPVPPELFNLPVCTSFTIDDNQLSGSIPLTIGNLQSVQYLDLTNNNFVGSLPSSLGNLALATTIYLRKTGVSGPIPDSLGNLASIQNLFLDNNKLTGSVPVSLGNLTDTLQMLDISNNQLTGFMPDGLLPLLNKPDPANPGKTKSAFNYLPQNTDGRFCSSVFPNLSPCPFATPPSPTFTPPSPPPTAPAPSPSSSSSSSSSKTGLIVGVAIGVIVAVVGVLGLCLWLFWRRKKGGAKANSYVETGGMSMGASEPYSPLKRREDEARPYSRQELEQATNGWKDVIGQGGYGPVYRWVLPGGTEIAIKRLRPDSMQGDHEFQIEVDLLRRLHFRRLVNLMGWCSEGGERMLIYEYKAMGSLDKHLFTQERAPLSWETRLRIAVDVALGIEYLHFGATPSVIHRDIKGANVLLDKDYNAFLADFGLSKLFETNPNDNSSLVKGTVGYLDPNYFRFNELTTASDVYSFGVVLLELLSGRKAVDMTAYSNDRSIVSWGHHRFKSGRVSEIVDQRLGSKYNADQAKKLVEVALACTQDEAEQRPTIRSVVRQLEVLCSNSSFVPALSPAKDVVKGTWNQGDFAGLREVRVVGESGSFPISSSFMPTKSPAEAGFSSSQMSASTDGGELEYSEVRPR